MKSNQYSIILKNQNTCQELCITKSIWKIIQSYQKFFFNCLVHGHTHEIMCLVSNAQFALLVRAYQVSLLYKITNIEKFIKKN